MFITRSLRLSASTAAALAIAVLLLCGASALVSPQAASAQSPVSCGNGQVVYPTLGQSCSTYTSGYNGYNGYSTCNGGYSVACAGSTCGATTYGYTSSSCGYYGSSNCTSTLFTTTPCGTSYGSSYGCGSTAYGGYTQSCGGYGGGASCTGIQLQFGQSCSNGVITCNGQQVSAGAACSASSGAYCASTAAYNQYNQYNQYTASQPCTNTSTLAAAAAGGPTTCPGGGYASTPAGCNGSGGGGAYVGDTSGLTTCASGDMVPSASQCPGGAAATTTTASTATSTTASTTSTTGGNGIALKTGWNLVGGPAGATVSGVTNNLFTLQSGDTNYESVAPSTQLKADAGYWVLATTGSTLTLPVPATRAGSSTVQLPAGQFVTIGNPGTTSATVAGADTVFVYDAASGNYSPTTTLAPGAGAWAFSSAGGTLTITNAAS